MQTNETEIVNGIEIEVDKAQRLIKKVIVKEINCPLCQGHFELV